MKHPDLLEPISKLPARPEAERERAYARRVSKGISSEIWPRNATQQTPFAAGRSPRIVLKWVP